MLLLILLLHLSILGMAPSSLHYTCDVYEIDYIYMMLNSQYIQQQRKEAGTCFFSLFLKKNKSSVMYVRYGMAPTRERQHSAATCMYVASHSCISSSFIWFVL